MKKILYIITKSNWGGAQRYVFDLATHLPKSEFEVAVALGGTGDKNAAPGLLVEKLKERGIKTIFVPSFMRDISTVKEFGAFYELLKIFKNEKPDIVHLNSSKAGIIGALASRISGVKRVVFTAHGWPFWEKRNTLIRGLIWLASWVTVVLSHKTICVSDYDLKVAKKMPFASHKVVRIYNGITSQVLGTGEKIRSSFPQGAKIVGTIGELNKNKNQRALIEEAKKNENLYVAIVGDGEERNNLEQMISEYGLGNRVKLFGFMPADEALAGFDSFALPSIKEGLPYVLVEAKRAGLPIVANRVGGVGEILDSKDMSEFSLEVMLKKTVAEY